MDTGVSNTGRTFNQTSFVANNISKNEEKSNTLNQQKAEVRKQYEGLDKWMKVPNVEPTNLTEDQWVTVRTPAFKNWFGDWEGKFIAQRAKDYLDNHGPVGKITGNEFEKSEASLIDRVEEYYKNSGNSIVNNSKLGNITLDRRGVKDSIGHGIGRTKAAAYAVVPEVIKHGFVYAEENNWKNRGYDTAVIIANVEIGEKPYICEVVVTKSDNRQGFYLHEVEIKENLDGVFKTAINGTPSRSRLIISQYLRKGNEASKIVDENGEPLVVYHGSDADFDTFDRMSHLEVRRLKWFHT